LFAPNKYFTPGNPSLYLLRRFLDSHWSAVSPLPSFKSDLPSPVPVLTSQKGVIAQGGRTYFSSAVPEGPGLGGGAVCVRRPARVPRGRRLHPQACRPRAQAHRCKPTVATNHFHPNPPLLLDSLLPSLCPNFSLCVSTSETQSTLLPHREGGSDGPNSVGTKLVLRQRTKYFPNFSKILTKFLFLSP